jgi:PAS domain S-box-containing protein
MKNTESDGQMLKNLETKTRKLEKSLKILRLSRQNIITEKERYKSLTDNISLGIYRSKAGPTGGFIEANPAMIRIFGFKSKQEILAGKPDDLWWIPSDREEFLKRLRDLEHIEGEEVILKSRDGEKMICSISVVAVRGPRGQVEFYDGVIEDITERRRLELDLEKNHEILRGFAQASPDMIFHIDLDGNIVFCSPSSEKIMGYPASELLHSNFRNYISSENSMLISKKFETACSGTVVQPFDFEVVHKNGEKVEIEINFTPIILGKQVSGVQGIARSNSEKKRALQAMQKEKTYAETIQRLMPSGLFTVDNDLVVTSWNNMAAKITGYQPHEILGKKCTILKGDQCRNGCGFTSPDIEKPIIGSICTIETKTGQRRTLRKNVDLLKDENGKVIGGIESFEDMTDQIATQESLEKQSYLMNTLLEHIPDRLYFKDLKSRFLKVSKSTAINHGFKDPEELVGKTDKDLFTGQHSEDANLDEQHIIKTGQPLIDIEEKETREDGTETWALSSKMPMLDMRGKVVGTFGISSDITERKKAEAELKRSSDLLGVTGRMAKVGGWEVDSKTFEVSWTEETYRIHDVPVDHKATLEEALEFYHPDDRSKLEKAIQRAHKHGEPYDMEIRFITAKGKHLWIHTMCKPIQENGETVKLLGTFQDITEQRALQDETREREELLDKITSSAQEAIVVIDNHGNVIFWNNSAEKIFGYTEEEIAGKNFHDLIVPGKYHEAHRMGFSKFKKSGQGNAIGTTLELDALRKNGQNFPVELSLSGVNVKGEWHAVGIIRDITERKESEGKLKEARINAESANRAKSEFLANMSHEIRTPMNAILGFSEILEEQLREDPQKHEYIKGIRNSGKGLLGLINDILDLSKIEAGKLDINYEPINPFAIIEEIRQIFLVKTSEKKLEFQIHVDAGLPRSLLFDETRMRQVLFNLIGNAIKFTNEGGVTVNVKSEDCNEEQSHVDVSIEVIDTGIGIPEKELQLIFEPFRQKDGQSTRKYGGTGLGLSITQRLVGIMGGVLEVSSTPGKGSTFTVNLPGIQVAAMSENKGGTEELQAKISFQNPRILLVEDIESNRKVITGYLGSQQINIVVAENGSVGVDMARAEPPDLILMDMQMPVMDGYEATRLIKTDERLKHIPVVALTASTMKSDEVKIANLCDGYLRKPVTKAQLISELKKYLPHTEVAQEAKGSDDQSEYLSKDLLQRLSEDPDFAFEISRAFNPEIIPEYHTLLKYRSNKRIKNFASLIADTGRKMQLNLIEAYGNELLAQVGAFNIKRITSMLEEFATLSEAIESNKTKMKTHE